MFAFERGRSRNALNALERVRGPSSVATAIYPSNDPLVEFSGLFDAVFKLFSKAGNTAFANASEAPEATSSNFHMTFPVREQNARRMVGFVLFISLAIKDTTSDGMGLSFCSMQSRWGGKAAARTIIAGS